MQLDSCVADNGGQQELPCQGLPDIDNVSLPRKRKYSRKSTGDSIIPEQTVSNKNESSIGPLKNNGHHRRKNSAPALSVRASSPVCSTPGVKKKLVMKKSSKTSEANTKPINRSKVHDSVFDSVSETTGPQNTTQNKLTAISQSPETEAPEPRRVSPRVSPRTRISPRNSQYIPR